jgi:hypothetical protein
MHTITRRLAGVALSLASVSGLFVATAPQAEAANACVNQVFSTSLTTKTCVRYLQRMVSLAYTNAVDGAALGGKRTLDPDGKYGDLTTSAVRNIQKHLWLYKTSGFTAATVDGKTGSQTWFYLCWVTEDRDQSLAASAGCDALSSPFFLAEVRSSTHG